LRSTKEPGSIFAEGAEAAHEAPRDWRSESLGISCLTLIIVSEEGQVKGYPRNAKMPRTAAAGKATADQRPRWWRLPV